MFGKVPASVKPPEGVISGTNYGTTLPAMEERVAMLIADGESLPIYGEPVSGLYSNPLMEYFTGGIGRR